MTTNGHRWISTYEVDQPALELVIARLRAVQVAKKLLPVSGQVPDLAASPTGPPVLRDDDHK